MRVVLLPSAFAPSVGGVEELTRRLADGYLARGDEVEVWTIRHPPHLAAEEMTEGVRVRRFELTLPPAKLASTLRFPIDGVRGLLALLRAEREFRPDILHVQCFSNNGVYATVLSKLRRLPLVVSLQGETVMDDADIYCHSALLRAGLRLGLRRANEVTACSAFVLDDARERFGLPASKGQVVYNGVCCQGDAVPNSVAFPFRPFVFGLGRVVPKKGFDLLLRAWATVADDHPEVTLVIAGDGTALESLRDLSSTLRLSDRVHFVGRVGRGEVAWLMDNAEVFVLPSRVEPFGIVLLEALRAERPVVVSSRGGASEIVRHQHEGLVVDPENTSAMASAIGRLLDDRPFAAGLAQAGRKRVQRFDWPQIIAEYQSIYERCAK